MARSRKQILKEYESDMSLKSYKKEEFWKIIKPFLEADARRFSVKKVFLKISQNS